MLPNKVSHCSTIELNSTYCTNECTHGAGDTFCACVLNFVLERGLDGVSEEDLHEMLRFANAAAYLVTTRKGAIRSMPELAEVQDVLNRIR